jgi:hypothetical protein
VAKEGELKLRRVLLAGLRQPLSDGADGERLGQARRPARNCVAVNGIALK